MHADISKVDKQHGALGTHAQHHFLLAGVNKIRWLFLRKIRLLLHTHHKEHSAHDRQDPPGKAQKDQGTEQTADHEKRSGGAVAIKAINGICLFIPHKIDREVPNDEQHDHQCNNIDQEAGVGVQARISNVTLGLLRNGGYKFIIGFIGNELNKRTANSQPQYHYNINKLAVKLHGQ